MVGFVFLALWQLAPRRGWDAAKLRFGEFQRIEPITLFFLNFFSSFYFRLPKLVPLINLYQEQELYYKI